jgi:hypothetical protein
LKTALFLLQLTIVILGFPMLYIYILGGMGYTWERLPRGIRYYYYLIPFFIALKIVTIFCLSYLYKKKKALWPLLASLPLTLFCVLLPPLVLSIPQPSQEDHLIRLLPNSQYQQKAGSCKRGEKHGTCQFTIMTTSRKNPLDFSGLKPVNIERCNKIDIQHELKVSQSFQKLFNDFPTVLNSEATQCYHSPKFRFAQILRISTFVLVYD